MLPPDDLPQPLFDAMIAAPLLLKIGWALMFVVLFPVVEELLFRGFLFTGLAQSWGPTVAGVLTTLVFVAVHMPKVDTHGFDTTPHRKSGPRNRLA